ncbi:hypothetical protein, partial [Desulfurobacterium indicum]|uniref:hypothetical protein n=1 Tax=Desulfurobacterium indicum TaxID=1914305 RepID=UPI0011981E82
MEVVGLTAFLVVLSVYISFAANVHMYLLSAHGNGTYGVKRNSMIGYSRGNCDNCHEMHASQNGAEPAPVNGAPS